MAAISAYLGRITPSHADKPDFVATVNLLVQPLVDSQVIFQSLLTTFDVDTAIGAQLDAVGQWIGRTRQISQPIAGAYFSFDTAGVGFDQGNWKGAYDSTTGITSLDDDVYRALLKAKIIMNSWDGTIATIAKALSTLFGNSSNVNISIEDNFDMTMTVGISGQVPSAVVLSLLEGGYVPINPSGVQVNYVVTSVNTTALFGFDTQNSTVAGFDTGSWSGQPGTGPSAPLSLSLVSATQTGVTLSWLPPEQGTGPYTYQLEYQLAGALGVWVLAPSPTSTTTGQISGLTPNTTYSVAVYAINSTGPGVASAALTVSTAVGIPAQVTGVVANAASLTSIALIWNAVAGNSITYQVLYRVTGSGSAFAPYGSAVSATSLLVSGLTSGSLYDFEVQAISSVGAGPASAIVSLGTSGSTPGVPQNLVVTDVDGVTLAAEWTQPLTGNGPYNYLVQIAQNTVPVTYSTVTATQTLTPTGGAILIPSLQSGVGYLVRVAASNAAGSGPFTASVPGVTQASAADQVTGVQATAETASSITLAWAVAPSAATYQMQYQTVGATTWTPAGSPVTTTTGTITGLAAGTSYNVQVVGISAASVAGVPSALIAVTTTGAIPSQVINLTATAPTATSVVLTWYASTGSGTVLYQPQYRLTGYLTWTSFGALTAALTETVSGLQSGVGYDFQVVPQNSFGNGPASATVSASTLSVTILATWNAADHSANLALSNNNLTATAITTINPPTAVVASIGTVTGKSVALSWTASTTSNFYGVRGTNSHATGKQYIEFALTSSVATFAVGLANATFNWTSAGVKGLGYDANSLGVFPNAPAQSAYINGVSLLTAATVADVTGDTVSLAVDFDNKLFWFSTNAMRTRLGATAWNNSATANPSTGVGGISTSALTAGSYFPAFNASEPGNACTINTGASAFVVALPTNFVAWNAASSANIVYPPGQVTGVTIGTPTYNSLPVTWTAVSGATSYNASYCLTTTPGVVLMGPPATTTTASTVTNLLPGTSYTVYVQAFNAGGAGPISSAVMKTTAVPTNSIVAYRGLNLTGSNLSAIGAVATAFPHANACIIPVFISTASQTSTDVVLTATLATITGWIDAANTAGLKPFLGVYLTCRDGTPRQTITPGPSATAVAAFFANLQSVCTQVATLGLQQNAVGMWCGVDIAPWYGLAQGDTGPFSGTHVTQWQSIYNACKAIWPTGIIGYAAAQNTIGLATPTSDFTVDFSIWDVVCFDIYPGSSNTFTSIQQFEAFFDDDDDPDPSTQSSTGPIPLFQALANYATLTGRPIYINACGIIPADGNQLAPGAENVLPPPYDFTMQSAWWVSVMNEITKHASSYAGFFASDGGLNTYVSPYTGLNYYGLQGLAAGSNVDTAFSGLMGNGTGAALTAPTGLTVSAQTGTGLTLSWTAIAGANITYVPQIAQQPGGSLVAEPATSSTSYAFTGLSAGTNYQMVVTAQQGALQGPSSAIVSGTTTGTSKQTISVAIPLATGAVIGAGSTFTVTVAMTGFTSAPSLVYYDDDVLPAVTGVTLASSTTTGMTLTWNPVTEQSGTALTNSSLTALTFTHPGMTAGTHTIIVSNGSVSGTATYSVSASAVSTVSPNDTLITLSQEQAANYNLFITDSSKNVWAINAAQQITVNGTIDTTTTQVSQIAYVNSAIWYENASSLWFSKTTPSATWLPAGGTKTGPFSGSSTLSMTITAPTGVVANTAFTLSGTLTGYATAPTLRYTDDASGVVNYLPTGNVVSLTAWSFLHPGLPAGAHSIVLTDVNAAASTASASYTITATTTVSLITPPLASATLGSFTTSAVTANGVTTQYLTLLPSGYTTANSYPFLIYLHQDSVASISALQTQVTPWFNTVAWREAYPCVLLIPYLDQTNSLTPNWGGITTATQPAENNVVQLIQTFQANYSIAVGHTYITGTGAGAAGAWDLSYKYNRLTGTLNKLIDAFLSLDGAIFTLGSPTPIAAAVTNFANYPIYCIHGQDQTTTVASGVFSIAGGKVISPAGTPFYGRGVAVGQDSLGTFITNAACQPLTTLFPNINFVRIPCYISNGAYITPATLAPYVNKMTALGIVVVIEDHSTSDGSDAGGGAGVVLQAGQTYANGLTLQIELDWYAALATQFISNTYVWFGTTNEPAYSPESALSTWQQQIYNAIRATGNNNIIEIEQPGGGNPNTMGASNGLTVSVYNAMKNIVFGPHFYSWLLGGQTNVVPQSSYVSNITSTVATCQTITSQDGLVPVGCFEFGPSTTDQSDDVSGMAQVDAVIACVASGVLFGFLAWNTETNAPDALLDSNTSLSSPYGTAVAAATALNTTIAATTTTTTPTATVSTPTAGSVLPGGSSNPDIVAPLTGSVVTTSWSYLAASSGMEYILQMPANYDASKRYPLLVFEHTDDDGSAWYNGGISADQSYGVASKFSTYFNNNSYFQTRYPCIMVFPLLNQNGQTSDGEINFGGYGDSLAGHAQVIALIKQMIATYPINTGRIYAAGASMGGTGTIVNMCLDNTINGSEGQYIFAAGLAMSGVDYDAATGSNESYTVAQSVVNQFQAGIPLGAIHGASDTDQPSTRFSLPLFNQLGGVGGNQYGMPWTRAASTNFYLLIDANLGHDTWDTYCSPTGQAYWDWLFSHNLSASTGTTTSTAVAIGPVAATSSFVNVDFTNLTGQTVSQYVWGVSTGTLSNNNFSECADTTLQAILKPLAFPLYRFNATGGYTENAFPNGATTSANMATVFGPLINNAPLFMPSNVRIIIGLGNQPNNWGTAAAFGQMCGAVAAYFNTTKSTATGQPLPIYGFEIGNETDGGSGTPASYYYAYFNAASAAIKAVNPTYKMLGPINSYVSSVSTFTSSCTGNYDVLDYHWYMWGNGQSQFDSSGGLSAVLSPGSNFGGAVANAVSSTTPIFIGEYNQNDTYGTLSGGQSPGVLNTYMCNIAGAVFNAQCILSGLNATSNFQMAGIWEVYQDSDYGLIGATDVAGGGNAVAPGAYLLSKAASTIYGPRVAASLGTTNPPLNCVAVAGPTLGQFALMMINYSTSTACSGAVALSHLPLNAAGTGTINAWTISPANPNGLTSTLSVKAGVTASVTVPAESVVILYNGTIAASTTTGTTTTTTTGATGQLYPSAWEKALYAAYGGSSSYAGTQAPNSKMSYLFEAGLSNDVWDTYYPLPAGKPFWDWLFSGGATATPSSTTTTVTTTGTSPNGTTISTVGPVITDANGNTWGLNSAQVIVVNGVADTTSANVITLVYSGGLIYQENASLLWWSKTSPSANWISTSAPAGTTTTTTTTTTTQTGGTTTPSGTRVTAPQTGTITTGNWVTGQQLSVAAMPHGFIAYDYLMPANYSTSVIYPLLFYGHENTEGTNNNADTYPSSGIWNQTVTNGSFNTVAFRTNFPCIVVLPYCDQTDESAGQGENFGGYNDTPNSGGNEQGVNALAQHFIANFSVDATRVYCTGDSLGGIGSLAWMVDNNRAMGMGQKIWTAGMGFADQMYRPANGQPNNTTFAAMKTVPYIAVSQQNSGGSDTDGNSSTYDKPAWQYYTGNTNYPSKSQYDSSGVAALRAGTSEFYYLCFVSDSQMSWDEFRQLNADGGDGTNLYTLLFSFMI